MSLQSIFTRFFGRDMASFCFPAAFPSLELPLDLPELSALAPRNRTRFPSKNEVHLTTDRGAHLLASLAFPFRACCTPPLS